MILVNAITNSSIVEKFFNKTGIKLNYLIAYNNLDGQAVKLTDSYRHMINKVYLDSGAFAGYKNKVKSYIHEYKYYIDLFGDRYDYYFTLDMDFDDPSENLNYYNYLVDRLPSHIRKPIPVIHDPNNPIEEIDTYVGLGCDYIALGSDAKDMGKILEEVSDKYPDLKIHVLGTLRQTLLEKYKPYSADASTYAQDSQRGIRYWDPNENKGYFVDLESRDKDSKEKFKYSNFPKRDGLDQFLRETFQFVYSDLISNIANRQIVNLYYFNQLENYINSL